MDFNDIRLYVDDRPQDGVFRVHRNAFADPELFELEMKYIFERTWTFLAVESQIARPHDYITTYIARTPVLVTRDANGAIGAFVNVCRHRGAAVAKSDQGNAKVHTCSYHGWAYDSAGKNIDIKDQKTGCYGPEFAGEDHDLLPVGRVESYKGLVFGSLSPDVPPLADYLGELRFFIDLAMEQGPHGMEAIPGRTHYTFAANWKLQMDNGQDMYHLTSTHSSFLDVLSRRGKAAGSTTAERQYDWTRRVSQQAGMFHFRYGHDACWINNPEPEKRPIYPMRDEIRARVGELRAEWMLKGRNIVVFPNLQIAESTSLLIRSFRPLAVGLTEMRVHCLAPIGEARAQRAARLRQFEDFFNPSGLATPDDTVIYEECQRGFEANTLQWLQGYSRGISTLVDGQDEIARAIDITPQASLNGHFDVQNETCFHPPYREWMRLIEAGLAGRKAYP